MRSTRAVMTKCEWGRDDYSLNVQYSPAEPITEADLIDDAPDIDDAEDMEAAGSSLEAEAGGRAQAERRPVRGPAAAPCPRTGVVSSGSSPSRAGR